MLPEGTVRADQIWKRFRADRRRQLLRDEVDRMRDRLRGRADDWFRWVLRDVSFELPPGESLALIGSNGSGKSTLLKILTRVMSPYAGGIAVSGRVGALIEVKAGIHPDLTGRENVYLYGSLLGLSRSQVNQRFDEIVAFAEVSDAIDRQVKFYSSGMQMRLGFAVAAFLEPAVLLVDEVLAVGDASFQHKCLNRMREVLTNGTTLVLVSHDLAAVEATCARGLWLEQGTVRATGTALDVVAAYRAAIEEAAESDYVIDGPIRVVKAQVSGPDGTTPQSSQPLDVRLVLETPTATPANIFVGVTNGPATPIFVLRRDLNLAPGETEVRACIEHLPLPRGRYFLWMGIFDHTQQLLPWQPAARFDVAGPGLSSAPRAIVRQVPIHVDNTWEVRKR